MKTTTKKTRIRSHAEMIVTAVKEDIFSRDLKEPENVQHALTILQGASVALAAIDRKVAA